MQEPMLRLNGVNEDIQVRIETEIHGADSPKKVSQAVLALFPEFKLPTDTPEPELGKGSRQLWSSEQVPLNQFLTLLHRQQILDTALDHMSAHYEGNATVFTLSRQAALAGKISFPLPSETPLGGVITVHLSGENLADWMEAATWHRGRDSVPKAIRDERSMGDDGEAVTWI